MAQFSEFIQNLDKKKALIVLGVAVLVIAFVWLLFNLFFISEQLPETEEQLKRRVFQNAESVTQQEGYKSYTIVSNYEKNFQITYQSNVDRFDILIHTGSSGSREERPDNLLTMEEILSVKEEAEQYFLNNVLETDNEQAACKLNVLIQTTGDSPASLPPSPLSFCE